MTRCGCGMGKRSNFARLERDFYQTPREAVLPLIPHLRDCRYYAEPCVGDGALVGALHSLQPKSECLWMSDLEPQFNAPRRDALDLGMTEFADCDYIITNPPWDRKVLHQMINHFSAMRPTWLLFDADWVHTKQSVPFMPWLRKIVSVGRVKWIPDSKMTGKDNCAWHLFDQNATGPCEFVGRVRS